MSFTSFRFILFFVIIYIVNWIYVGIQKACNCKNQNAYRMLLLLESYVFILVADWKTALSLFVLTTASFLVAVGIDKYREKAVLAKSCLLCGLILAVGQLAWFKYYDFLAQNISALVGWEYNATNPYSPLGISFFTFSAIAYMMDVYRKKYAKCSSFMDLALYLAFFPKLLSGPIIRPDKFIEQIQDGCRKININNLQVGVQFVAWGLFKKMVLADHLAVFVDDVFLVPSAFDFATCLWAMLSYSLQIYFDFSGYSDMAIGFSRMLGIEIENNFNLPYISKNVTEFWKRWHISLSSWLQEYVYISLGGNRKGKFRTKLNLLITMLLGGLWHGANWTFIIWGLIHGAALIVQKAFRSKVNSCKKWSDNLQKVWSVCSVAITFVFVTIAWVFFRASSLTNAFEMFHQVGMLADGITQIYTWTWLALTFVICEVAYAFFNTKKEDKKYVSVKYPIWNLNTIKGLMMFFTLAGLTIILAYVGNTAFIYGKF